MLPDESAARAREPEPDGAVMAPDGAHEGPRAFMAERAADVTSR